ncbi:hypothetical protein KUTeg_004934 [Tegillarca granosa]|uniref:Uncharacterized protein n=1 Tax=Tegillarca granosa TaxID=220873 RepID=A0ABQ9FIA7_TEGGR|nr:hypothetical protein KUTeg_004934 [Tegillarca granosa]
MHSNASDNSEHSQNQDNTYKKHPKTEISEDEKNQCYSSSSFDTTDFVEDKTNTESKKEEMNNVFIERLEQRFMYDVHETPPFHLTLMFALQQCFLSLSRSLSAALFVADIVCARNDEALKARLLSTTFFMSGLCTFLQNTIGISLMIAGFIHMLIGMTGLVGFLIRFIGPVTVVPSLTVVGLFSYRATVGFASAHWGIAFMTAGTTIILSLYLRKMNTPIPIWTPKGGCRIIRFPFHKVFSVLIAAIFGWVISIIITEAGGFSSDPKSKEFYARTDSRTYVINMANWFLFPTIWFSAVQYWSIHYFSVWNNSFCHRTHIGDYYACARVCDLPAPPPHSVNRGIMIEGISSLIAGSAGASHATSTFGGNIGAIGITKVASLRVFQLLGIIYMIFGVIGKIGAVCVTIPYSVIGGMQMINFGVLVGVMISNIQFTDMTSTRNHVIIGFSMFVGLMMPYWMRENPEALDTGNY